MSLAEATSRSARFARWNWAKLCVFAAFFGLLFYVGQQGRQQVDRQVQLAEVVALADQSLILIDEQLVGGGKGSQAISLALVAQAIGSRIAEFETKNRTLSKEEQLDLRCARAASLIAGQRPAEALAQLGEDAESGATDSDRKRRVLKLRGEALFAQQDWAEAAKRFEQIIAFAEAIRIAESAGPNPETNGPAAGGNAGDDLLRVDLLALWSEDGIDVQGRPMPRAGGAEMRQARVLASALQNRARTLLLEGKTHECIADLSRAADLPGSPALKDFAAHQARALTSLGWIYAAHPDPAIRDSAKAKEIARKACNLSEWKTHGPVEALAAAHAQAGEYPQAVQWQETALALAPAGARSKAAERLQKYRSRNPPILELEGRPPRS